MEIKPDAERHAVDTGDHEDETASFGETQTVEQTLRALLATRRPPQVSGAVRVKGEPEQSVGAVDHEVESKYGSSQLHRATHKEQDTGQIDVGKVKLEKDSHGDIKIVEHKWPREGRKSKLSELRSAACKQEEGISAFRNDTTGENLVAVTNIIVKQEQEVSRGYEGSELQNVACKQEKVELPLGSTTTELRENWLEHNARVKLKQATYESGRNKSGNLKTHEKTPTDYTIASSGSSSTSKTPYPLKSHPVTNFKCSECTYSCTTRGSLTVHRRIHTGERPFACRECSHKCSTYTDLKSHIKSHKEEPPRACNKCTYSCDKPSALKIHMRAHTGEKPYACNYCNLTCTTRSQLKTHTLIHTGEKPYACMYCECGFRQSGSLKLHIRNQH